MELGSDSARVNEVAKLCRAVALGGGRKRSSEGFASGVVRERDIGLLKGRGCRRQELHERLFSDREPDPGFASKMVCLSLCAMG